MVQRLLSDSSAAFARSVQRNITNIHNALEGSSAVHTDLLVSYHHAGGAGALLGQLQLETAPAWMQMVGPCTRATAGPDQK